MPHVGRCVSQRPTDEVIRVSNWFQAQAGAGDDPRPTLFVADGGQPLEQQCWGRTFRRYCAAGVKDITFHSLRHYHITEVAHEPLTAAVAQSGHASPKTTKIYLHNSTERQRAAVLDARPLGQVLDVGKPKRRQSLIGRS